jgi:hypothetical protein
MGGKCCASNNLHNIYDTLSFIESEEQWLRHSIDYSNKKFKNENDIA